MSVRYLPHVPDDFDRTPRQPTVVHVGQPTGHGDVYTSCGAFVSPLAAADDVDETVTCSTCRTVGKVEPW